MSLSLALQIVTASITVVGAAGGLISRLRGSSGTKKGIGYETLSVTPLIERTDDTEDAGEAANKLEIRFNDRVVQHPHLVQVRICNAERSTISKADFGGKPIRVTFEGAEVFRFAETCKPPTLAPKLRWGKHDVTIRPLDLNEATEIIVTALVTKVPTKVSCDGTILGGVGTGIRELSVGPPTPLQWVGLGFKWTWRVLCYVVSPIFFLWLIGRDTFKDGVLHGLLGMALFVAAVAIPMMLIAFVARLLDRRNWWVSLR